MVATVAVLSLASCQGTKRNGRQPQAAQHNPVVIVDTTAISMLNQQLIRLHQKYQSDSAKLIELQKRNRQQDSLLKARQTELDATKELLIKANEELERIKRRLANPRS